MKFLNRKKKEVFKLRPEDYVKGYEDDDHPCSGCIIRPICTEWCLDIRNYATKINEIANGFAKKWIPDKVEMRTGIIVRPNQVNYSNENILSYFRETKGKKASEIYNNDEAYKFLQKMQYSVDRTRSIWKNHLNKYGHTESSSSVSGVSSSSVPLGIRTKIRRPGVSTPYHSPIKVNQTPIPKNPNRLKIP